MKSKYIIILLLILIAILIIFRVFLNQKLTSDDTNTDSNKEYTLDVLSNLKNTSNFLPSAIKHIFLGKINSNGMAEGFHYNNIKDSHSYIIKGSMLTPNSDGVYKAKVSIDGKLKSDDDGFSTFFPNSLSPQGVINVINEAYKDRKHLHGNIYVGKSNTGIFIEMYLTDTNLIISAFPKY